MKRPLALDLMCCGGGQTKGLRRAGFDVVGVDIKRSPHYDGTFIERDLSTAEAVERTIREVKPDLVTSSPPCQLFSLATPTEARKRHANLIPTTRLGIERSGIPGWMENVDSDRVPFTGWWVMLCGSMFPETYHLKRHRRFELIGWKIEQPRHDRTLCVYGSDAHGRCDLCEDLAPTALRPTITVVENANSTRGANRGGGLSKELERRRLTVAVAGNGPPDAAQSARYKHGRNGAREVISVAGDGSGNRGRGPRRKTLTLAGNQGEGPGQTCGQNRAGKECIRWRMALGWLDGPKARYELRQCVPPVYADYLARRFLESPGMLDSAQGGQDALGREVVQEALEGRDPVAGEAREPAGERDAAPRGSGGRGDSHVDRPDEVAPGAQEVGRA